MRKKLFARHGKKILEQPNSSWTAEEQAAKIFYDTASKELYKMAPEIENLDKISNLYTRNEVDGAFGLLLKYIKKGFWVIFAIVVLLALVKFVFQ